MKKMMLFTVMVVMAMVANAQRVVNIYQGWAYLDNHQKVQICNLPCAGNWVRIGYTIEESYAMAVQEAAMREEMMYMSSPEVAAAGMYGAGMTGMYGMPIYGGSGSSFSIGNEHWGISTSSSQYGNYKRSATGLRIGSFNVGMSNAGYTQPTTATSPYTTATSGLTRGTAAYENQKHADARAAASTRSIRIGNNGTVRMDNGTTSTTATRTSAAPTTNTNTSTTSATSLQHLSSIGF